MRSPRSTRSRTPCRPGVPEARRARCAAPLTAAAGAQRVIVALSGGVDSAVAALLLRQQGYEVHGLFMSNWDEGDAYCTSARDYQDARAVARELGIVLHRVSFAGEYRERVFRDFLAELAAGRTPNPDVACNREIKFGVCRDYARRLGGAWLATGHYARLGAAADGPALLQARDVAKDQTYFLHGVARAHFADVLFPLGELSKAEVRARARRAGLPVHDKPDSTGICFVGERPFAQFLRQHLPEQPGPIETPAGERVGTHRGLAFYTLGQRAGLEIGGRADAAAEPWYVARKLHDRNALIVVQRSAQAAALATRALRTGTMNWLIGAPWIPTRAEVRVRHRQPLQAAALEPSPDGTLRVEFDLPQRAVTPGQYAVLYQGERCLGGAAIEETL
ncbi:MAG: tRNA 2-thiouridine(34) synthase MnmA [Gammaproteobacteria bacterium]|nr:tRNA 2-thiouridine(34) synthase MnmA [Gammaproteobacteria bacterium]